MATLTSLQISTYRKQFRSVLKRLEWLSERCLFKDAIVKGRPHEAYRKCGKSNCKCANDPKQRHGPYRTVMVSQNGRQQLYSIRKDEDMLWQQVVHYQYQKERLKEFKTLSNKITLLIEEVIEKRSNEFKK